MVLWQFLFLGYKIKRVKVNETRLKPTKTKPRSVHLKTTTPKLLKMMNFKIFLIVIIFCGETFAFPDGAPVDACVKPKPNQPYHGQAKPKPIETSPYQIIANDDRYRPGHEITVTIRGSEYFKGFFIQARDAHTNEWIGEWLETPNITRHPECSAVTHADPKEKQQAVFLWRAPKNLQGGQVYFTGTVLKEYNIFWSNLVNVVSH